MKQPIVGRWDRVRNTQTVCTAALCALDWDVCSQVCKGAGSWSVGIGEQAWGENCCWLWEDRLRGQEGGKLQQGMPTEEDWTAMEAGATAESHTGGGATIVASLSTHTSACQWTIKEALLGLALTRLLLGVRKNLARAGPQVPYVGCQKRPSLGPYLLRPWLPASLRIWHHWGSRHPSSHTTFAPGPHWGRPMSSKAS